MPVLDPKYISTWYHLKDTSNKIQIVESYNTTKTQELQPKFYVQGDIGTHVMQVGGIFYEFEFSSDALIIKDSANTFDIAALIFNGFDGIRIGGVGQNYLLENARLSISKSGVNANAKFISNLETAFQPVYGTQNAPILTDLIARTAQWYDCQMTFTIGGQLASNFFIESANININSNISKRYFINTNQEPYFSVDSYTVSGEFTIVIHADEFVKQTNTVFQIGRQSSGVLSVNGPTSLTLKIGNLNVLNIGGFSMLNNIRNNIRAGQVSTATFAFTAYAKF